MDETIDDMPGAYDAHQHVAQDLVDRARSEGVKLVGLGGLLTGFTKSILDYDVEIRRVICSTNAIESLNARYRRAVRARGHFPTEQAALKCLYLVTRSLDPTGKGRARWVTRWKPALNAFAITFEGRLFPSNNS
jgi:hypothetical protein